MCLRTRAERLCKGENVTKEKQHLRNMFVANGYAEEMTRKFFNKSNAKAVSHAEEEERKDTLYLPYIRGLSESVERAVKDLKIRTVFKTTLTLRRCLMKVKAAFTRHRFHGKNECLLTV